MLAHKNDTASTEQQHLLQQVAFIHLGSIVFFGLEEEAYRENIVEQLSQINAYESDITGLKKLKLQVGHAASHHLDKVLTKFFVSGNDADGQPCYIYCGIRGDILARFLKALATEPTIDIAYYATILTHGTGDLDEEKRRFMRETHQFSEKAITITNRDRYGRPKHQTMIPDITNPSHGCHTPVTETIENR